MKRFLARFVLDVGLQYRQGFYLVAGIAALVAALILNPISHESLVTILPPFVLTNLVMSAFFFVVGLVYFEKGEGTLEVQNVTPLRPSEYLASKYASLTVLSLVENLIVVVVCVGGQMNVGFLVIGITLACAIYVPFGLILAAAYDSVNEFLLPGIVCTWFLALPILPYFGVLDDGIMYLHPLNAPLVVMRAAFEPTPIGELAYGILYSVIWAGVAYYCTRRAFDRFVTRGEGVRS